MLVEKIPFFKNKHTYARVYVRMKRNTYIRMRASPRDNRHFVAALPILTSYVPPSSLPLIMSHYVGPRAGCGIIFFVRSNRRTTLTAFKPCAGSCDKYKGEKGSPKFLRELFCAFCAYNRVRKCRFSELLEVKVRSLAATCYLPCTVSRHTRTKMVNDESGKSRPSALHRRLRSVKSHFSI